MKNYIALNLFEYVQFFHYILCIKSLLSCFLSCRISPSQSCGPFRVYSVENFIFFDTIRNLIFTFPSDAQKFFHIFGTMAFFIPAIGLTWWDRCSKLTQADFCYTLYFVWKKNYLEWSSTVVQYIVNKMYRHHYYYRYSTCINIILISIAFYYFNMKYIGVRMSKDQNTCA